MLPSVFGENLFDEMFEEPFELMSSLARRNPLYGKHAKNLMKTDIRETDTSYELDIDLPGFKKEEVQATIEDGYLIISAVKGLDKDQKDDNGRYIRRERYAGQCSRSFYIGSGVETKDVTAKFEDGILKVSIPKREQKQLPEKNSITIE